MIDTLPIERIREMTGGYFANRTSVVTFELTLDLETLKQLSMALN